MYNLQTGHQYKNLEIPPLALITTTEAASRLGINQSRVRQLVLAGQLPAKKYGRDWMIEEADLERFEATRRPAGRPKDETSK